MQEGTAGCAASLNPPCTITFRARARGSSRGLQGPGAPSPSHCAPEKRTSRLLCSPGPTRLSLAEPRRVQRAQMRAQVLPGKHAGF